LGDRVDDRQSQTNASVGPRRVGAPEALEGVREEIGRKARAAVDEVQLDRPVPRPGASRRG